MGVTLLFIQSQCTRTGSICFVSQAHVDTKSCLVIKSKRIEFYCKIHFFDISKVYFSIQTLQKCLYLKPPPALDCLRLL